MLTSQRIRDLALEMIAYANGTGDQEPRFHKRVQENLRQLADWQASAKWATSKKRRPPKVLQTVAALWLAWPHIDRSGAVKPLNIAGRFSIDQRGRVSLDPQFQDRAGAFAVAFAELIAPRAMRIVLRCVVCGTFFPYNGGRPTYRCARHNADSAFGSTARSAKWRVDEQNRLRNKKGAKHK